MTQYEGPLRRLLFAITFHLCAQIRMAFNEDGLWFVWKSTASLKLSEWRKCCR